MVTRKQVYDTIRYEYATHSKETRESMRAYVENRISFETRLRAVKEGLKIYGQKKR